MKHFPTEEWLLQRLADEVQLEKDYAHVLLNWARAARRSPPVVLVGAGLSLNAIPKSDWAIRDRHRHSVPRCLTWKEFAEKLRNGLAHIGEDGETDALWLAELYEQTYDRDGLTRMIQECVPDHLLDPSDYDRAIFSIRWRAVLTTNYDTLLRRAHEGPGLLRECVGDADLVASAGQDGTALELLYLHGRIDRPESIVLTLNDYRRYAQRKPGMLTKVRQLFLQHPVMLVGVGATDPNFIQWSGWVSDLVQTARNPNISLAIGKHPGQARRSYWEGALRFVPLTLERLPKVLRILADFIHGARPAEAEEDASIGIRALRSVDQLVGELPALLSRIGGQQATQSDYYRRQRVARDAVRRAFSLRWGEATGNQGWDRVVALPQEYAIHEGARGAPSLAEQRQLLLDTFGDNWAPLLLALSEHLGPSLNLGGPIILRIHDEISRLSDTLSSESLRVRLQFQTLDTALEASGDTEPDAVARSHFGGLHLDGGQQKQLEDAIHRRRYILGLPFPSLSEGVDGLGAQELRRAAFRHTLDGDVERAATEYFRAAHASRTEGEAPNIEWLTIESARMALRGRPSGIEPPGTAVGVARLRDRTEALDARIEDLEQRTRDWVEYFQDLRIAAGHGAVDSLVRRRMGGRPSGAAQNAEISKHLVEMVEDVWAAPFLAGRAAEQLGLFQWDSGLLAEAARTLSRYGSELLGELTREFARNRRRPALDPELVKALLQPGRWPGEWLSRAEALRHTTIELRSGQFDALDEWVEQAVGSGVFSRQSVAVRAASLSEYFDASDSLAKILRTKWQMLSGSAVMAEWERLLARAQSDERYDSCCRAAAAEMGFLPWESWIESGELDVRAADQMLAKVLELQGPRAFHGRIRIFEVMLSLQEGKAEMRLPTGGRALHAMEQWVTATTSTPAEVWLRTACQVAIAPDPSTTKTALAKDLLVQARASLSPNVRTDTLNALAEVAAGIAQTDLPGLFAELGKWLEELAARPKDDPFRTYTTRAKAIGHLASRLLVVYPKGSASAQLRELLDSAMSASASSTLDAASLLVETLGSSADTLHRLVSAGMAETFEGSEIERRHALVAARRFLESNPTEEWPEDWFVNACYLIRSADPDIATAAIHLLGVVRKATRLPTTLSRPWSRWVSAMGTAIRDPRAYVAGAGAYAFVAGFQSIDQAERQAGMALMDVLTKESRAYVLGGMRLAQGASRSM